MIEPLSAQIEKLPEKTGVYIFKGDKETLYVGKATNIKKRVQSHFQAAKTDEREKRIIKSAEKINYIVTETETDALIEENILIKTYKPKHNVRLSDDKTYPYIKIDTKGNYPCLSIVRKMADDNAKYFGPYGDVGAMRNSLRAIRRLFPIRACKKELRAFNDRPCVYHHLGQCSAPCAGQISEKEYNTIVNHLILFLDGKMNGVIRNLQSEMADASLKQEYERAAALRDRIHDLEKTVQKVRVVLPPAENLDAIPLIRGEDEVCAQVLQVREGKIISSESFSLKVAEEASDEESLESFLKQYYLKRSYVPNRIIINKRIRDSEVIAKWLSERSQRKIEIRASSDPKLRAVLDLASENARAHLEQSNAVKKKASRSLAELERELGLRKMPKLIECFDISNLGEKEAVGSKIAFMNGTPNKKEYRMYKIKTVSSQDDPAMMGEIIRRRFTRLLEEKGTLPDLVVVDGGITQVKSAKKSMYGLGIDIPVIGLAKKLEQIYMPDGEILEPERNSAASLLLQHVRDEAHRFAVRYHRKRREKMLIS